MLQDLMEEYDLDKTTAERVEEIMDGCGVDEEDAIEIAQNE